MIKLSWRKPTITDAENTQNSSPFISDSEISDLEMAYSSSEFDDDVDTIGDGIEPYLFEPLATDADYEGGSEINDTEENLERLMDRNW